MADTGKWEVVRKNPKKTKPISENSITTKDNTARNAANRNKLTKSEAREYLERMPRLTQSDPIQESDVMYNVLTDQGSRKASSRNKQQGVVNNNTTNNNNQSLEKGEPLSKGLVSTAGETKDSSRATVLERGKLWKVVEAAPKSLEEAMRRIQADELRTIMRMVLRYFPGSCNMWLKDLTGYLNVKLNVEVADPTFAGKGTSYPLSAAPKDIRKVIESTLERCTDPSLVALSFERGLLEMAEDITHGRRCNGHRVMLQALVRNRPSLVAENLLTFENFRNTYQNRPVICLSLLWVAGVAGTVQLDVGLKLWLEVMLPVLGIRTYSKYVVDYLCTLLSLHPDLRSAGAVIGVCNFFPVLDTIFNNTANLPGNLHKDLIAVFPKLRSVVFNNKPETNLRNYFPSFLTRLDHACAPILKKELLDCLVQCLRTDSHCFSVWKQLYARHLVNSSLLLEHLTEKLDALGSNLPLLRKTLGEFGVANQKLYKSTEKAVPDGLRQCRLHCKDVLAKTKMESTVRYNERVVISSRRSSVLRPVLFVLFVALASAIMYDCQLNGSFKASNTRRLMQKYGVLGAYDVMSSVAKRYYDLSHKWASKNMPHYYAVVSKFSAPYVTIVFNWILIAGSSILNFVWLIHMLVILYIPVFLEVIDTWFPGAVETIMWYVGQAWSIALQLTVIAWTYVVYGGNIITSWLCEKVLTGPLAIDNLQTVMFAAVDTVQSYTVDAFNWIQQQLHNTAK